MDPHNPDHALVLERILVGDLPRTANEARALLEQCVECRERLSELDALQSQLSAAGEEERAGVAQANAGAITTDSERRIQEFVDSRVRPLRATSRRNWLVAAALAASVCGVIGYRLLRPTTPAKPADVYLNAGEHAVLRGDSPQGSKASFDEFKWTAPALEAGETFRLRIKNLDADDVNPLVLANIGGTVWRRDSAGLAESPRVEEFFARSPHNIEWQVEIWKAGGATAKRKSQSVQASRD